MQRRLAGTATLLAVLSVQFAGAQAAIMAPAKPLPTDPPRIPLTRSVAVELQSQDPELLVKGLYTRKTPFLGKVSGYRKAFMPDLARAMAQDAQPDDVRVIDFDWRYGAPRKQARRLKLTTSVSGETATVTARFRVKRKLEEVRYQLFRRRTGWRIHDVLDSHGEGAAHAWSLRSCLHMRGAQLARTCDKPTHDPESMKPEPLPPLVPAKPAVRQPTLPKGAVPAAPSPPTPPKPAAPLKPGVRSA